MLLLLLLQLLLLQGMHCAHSRLLCRCRTCMRPLLLLLVVLVLVLLLLLVGMLLLLLRMRPGAMRNTPSPRALPMCTLVHHAMLGHALHMAPTGVHGIACLHKVWGALVCGALGHHAVVTLYRLGVGHEVHALGTPMRADAFAVVHHHLLLWALVHVGWGVGVWVQVWAVHTCPTSMHACMGTGRRLVWVKRHSRNSLLPAAPTAVAWVCTSHMPLTRVPAWFRRNRRRSCCKFTTRPGCCTCVAAFKPLKAAFMRQLLQFRLCFCRRVAV